MKCFIVIACLIALALAHPVDDSQTTVIKQKSQVNTDGYKFNYKTSDGVSRFEEGMLKNAGTEDEELSVNGSVSWTGPDGEEYNLTYTAGKDGFKPNGKHLPGYVPHHDDNEEHAHTGKTVPETKGKKF